MANLTARLGFAAAGRQAEVSGADWTTGCNPGSCMPVIGLTTGVYNFKADDWARTAVATVQSQRIGGSAEDLLEPVDGNDTFAFAAADAQTANGVEFDAATGAVNRSGATIPAGAWLFGTVPVA